MPHTGTHGGVKSIHRFGIDGDWSHARTEDACLVAEMICTGRKAVADFPLRRLRFHHHAAAHPWRRDRASRHRHHALAGLPVAASERRPVMDASHLTGHPVPPPGAAAE
jgi:hypothetical protein